MLPKELFLFLGHQVHIRRVFSRKQLNEALRKFNFHSSINSGERSRLSDASLSLVSSASALGVFVLHLTLILNSVVPFNLLDQFYHCLIMAVQITQLVLSPILSVEAVGFFFFAT